VPKPGVTLTVEEVRAFCEGRIARYKIPRHVKFVASFPLTVTGKVQKYLMREQIKQELGLVDERTA
jgi:fatty-acyl-CoA synthase